MPTELYVGLMSGTSLDAIDAVLVQFDPLQVLAFYSQSWSDELRQQLLALCSRGDNEIERLGQLDRQVGQAFAEATEHLLSQWGGERRQIRAIGSHGQTVRHHPGGTLDFSLQIGDGNRIAERCQLTTVCDFRRRDLAAGGQGAPLVPAVHAALFQTPTRDRIIVNLGGIANITLLPASSQQAVTGYDTGPANLLLDAWCQRHLGQPYDADGQWASGGQINPQLLASLLSEPYLQLPAPKSTGRELFNLAWLEPHLVAAPLSSAQDVQATLVEFTVLSLAEQIQNCGLFQPELYLCGGGAANRYLLQRLALALPQCLVDKTDRLGLPAQQVEAVAFAWLARQTLASLPGNLTSVTGARHPVILGAIYPV